MRQSDLFSGDGEVRALLRVHDWSGFAPGPPEQWPDALKMAVRLMLDSRVPMYVAWKPDLPLLYNDAYTDILGRKHPDALTRPIWEVWPELAPDTRPVIEHALNGNAAFLENVALQVVRDGRPENAWFTFSVSPIRNEDETVAGLMATIIETTKQVLFGRRQLAEQDAIHRLLDQAPGFMAVLQGPEHIFKLANNAYRRLVGYRDVIGKRAREAVPDVEGQGFFELLDRVYATGEPFVGYGVSAKIQTDPDTQPTERFLNFIYQPIIELDGSISGIFIEGSDITDQHLAQQELTRVNQELAEKIKTLEDAERRQVFQLKLADLLRNLSDPREMFSRSSALLGRHLNACRVLYGDYDVEKRCVSYHSNYTDGSVGELVGTYPTDLFGHDNFASLERGTTWISTNLAQDPRTSGPDTWPTFEELGIHSAVAVPLDRDGALIASMFVNSSTPREWTKDEIRLIEDTAERTWNAVEHSRVVRALRQADQRKDEFLAMLAHELRNPLAPISAAAELMGMAHLDEAGLIQTSQIITRQVRHMTGLVDDLLDVSRVTRGLVVIEKIPQDVKSIVANAVEQVRPLIESRRHRLELHLARESAHVAGDQKRLVQILTNLLNNAAKYTPEGGHICLRTDIEGDQVVLSVHDDGIGIDPELQPRIFDLFAQAERTSDRSQGGLGLGLALVRSLVDLHDGQVTCSSEGIGKGSKFTVRLPRLPEQSESPERRQRKRNTQAANGSLRLMVVDDNVDAARMLAMYLEALGYEVIVEHGSRHALERASTESPNICLLDIGLPDMDGNELARRLRAQPETAGAVLIAVSGYGQESDRETALAAGFDHYLVKPVDTGKLSALLARISDS